MDFQQLLGTAQDVLSLTGAAAVAAAAMPKPKSGGILGWLRWGLDLLAMNVNNARNAR